MTIVIHERFVATFNLKTGLILSTYAGWNVLAFIILTHMGSKGINNPTLELKEINFSNVAWRVTATLSWAAVNNRLENLFLPVTLHREKKNYLPMIIFPRPWAAPSSLVLWFIHYFYHSHYSGSFRLNGDSCSRYVYDTWNSFRPKIFCEPFVNIARTYEQQQAVCHCLKALLFHLQLSWTITTAHRRQDENQNHRGDSWDLPRHFNCPRRVAN